MIESILELKNKAKKKLNDWAWPTREDEEWRRSDPQLIPFDKLDVALERNVPSAQEQESYTNFIRNLQEHVNEIKGITFYDWDNEQSVVALPRLEQALDESLDKVDVWRLAHINVGGVLVVDEGTTLDKVLKVELEGRDEDSVLNPVLVLLVAEEVHVGVDIHYRGDGFFSAGIYADLETKAFCHINQFQNTSLDSFIINSTFASTEAEAEFTNTSGQLGGMMAVDRVYGKAIGTHAHLHLNGYYFAHEDQLIDVRTYQSHIAEDANSRCLYHGLGTDEAHSIYRGLIKVGEEAVETDAYLTNTNLLLSEEARMDSIPCLNILTNDVRCSHGSTTGTLDSEHIYYLMSRGLSETEAKELLIEGFFHATFDPTFEETNVEMGNVIRRLILGSI